MVRTNAINTQMPVVQFGYNTLTTPLDIADAIPADDTKPQNTEGQEVLTATITPTNANNILVIHFSTWAGSVGGVGVLAGALFQDATSDAIAANVGSLLNPSSAGTLTLNHIMTAGTTSATTFKVRVGGLASPGAMTINGYSSGGYFGGVSSTILEIWEMKA